MTIQYTPELQAQYTNELLEKFGRTLDQALKERLKEINPKVPSQTIQSLRYQIIEANASDISAQYFLYFQDSGRISEMRKISPGRVLPVDAILDWIKKGRQGLFSKTPGYQEGASSLDKAKKLERIASAIAVAKSKGTARKPKERKERAWVNKYVYSWYNRLVSDFIDKQGEFLIGMVKGAMPLDLGEA
jgi:hypothetical protein